MKYFHGIKLGGLHQKIFNMMLIFILALIGVFGYGLVVFFQLVTLPTEFNASRRALVALEGGNLLDQDELGAARKTLRAAALTYVAALAVSLMQFLRLLALVTGQRGRRR